MIKKITTCFLVMAIAVGCAQAPVEADKPEEPPVVEQPQKPVEPEKPVDPPVIEQPQKPEVYDEIDINKVLNISNEVVDIKIDVEQYKDQLFIQEPTLLWESEDAKRFNEELSQLAQTCREELTYYESGYWHTASLLNTKYYINDDILSIVVKLDRLLSNAGVAPSEFTTYNFSLTTRELLSNSEIFERYQISETDFQNELDIQLDKDYLPCSAPTNNWGVREKPCYGEYAGEVGGKYGETSIIYVREKSIHIFVNVRQAMYQENIDIKVKKID